MSILDADILQQELPFEAAPDALGLKPINRQEVLRTRHGDIPNKVWVAKGAELAGVQMTFWDCPWSTPHGMYPDGYIVHTALIEPPYDPRWGDDFPKEDFCSSYQHMEEIIERQTHGMLNISRLKRLNKIYDGLKD